MRTELSVVSRTQLYKNAYMIQKSFLMLVCDLFLLTSFILIQFQFGIISRG